MKVKELIEQLQAFDPEMEVWTYYDYSEQEVVQAVQEKREDGEVGDVRIKYASMGSIGPNDKGDD